jgi:hypothetical protein
MPELIGSLWGLGIALGPMVGLLVLLGLSERRETRLLQLVLDQLGARELRGHVAARVRCRWLAPGAVVEVHLVGCPQDLVRTATTRLARSLPAGVRLEVTGLLVEGRAFSFTVMTARSLPLAGPVPAHVARR